MLHFSDREVHLRTTDHKLGLGLGHIHSGPQVSGHWLWNTDTRR